MFLFVVIVVIGYMIAQSVMVIFTKQAIGCCLQTCNLVSIVVVGYVCVQGEMVRATMLN